MSKSITSDLKDLTSQFERSFSANTVVGKPIEIEDKIAIPLVKVSFEAGGSSGGGSEKEVNSGTGFAMGFRVGGGAEPLALLVFFKGVGGKEGIHLYELKPRGVLGDFAEAVPKIMEIFSSRRGGKTSQKQDEEKKKLMEI